jgi:hypothetical protein
MSEEVSDFYNSFAYGMPSSILVSEADNVVAQDVSDDSFEEDVPALFREAELRFESLPTLSDYEVRSQELELPDEIL